MLAFLFAHQTRPEYQCVDARRFEDQIVIARGEFSVTIARFTAFRTDHYGHSQSKKGV